MKVAEEEVTEASCDTVEIKDLERAHWLGKLVTFSVIQEDVVESHEDLPLVISGFVDSGKTSMALEKLRKIEEKFKGRKILYITKSERLIKQSKELYEYKWYDKAEGKVKISVSDQIEFRLFMGFLKS
ncbi:MAG: hypothetical protein ACR5KV_06595 [Wolbachia sp.]